MDSKLREDFLSGYLHQGKPDQALLSQFDLSGLNPEFEENMRLLATDVPEYGIWEELFVHPDGTEEKLVTPASPRAVAEIESLFFKKKQDQSLEVYSERKIRNNLIAYIIAVRARLAQMEHNHFWLENLDQRERNEQRRLDGEREHYYDGKTKLYYPNITRRLLQASSPQEFERAPNNHSKMVQRIMTSPTDRRIIMDEKQAYEKAQVESLIVNPLELSDLQLEHLGFILPWTGEKRVSREEKLRHISDLVGRVKTELSALEPLGQGDPHDKFGRYRLFGSLDGKVIGVTNPVRKKPSYYKTSLVDSLRRSEHIHTGYPRETGRLARTIDLILQADRDLQKGNWQQVKDSAELEKAKSIISEAVNSLKKVRDPDKVEALGLLKQAMTLESTYTRVVRTKGQKPQTQVTVRLNPGAKRAQLEKAVRKLKERRSRVIPKISRYNANDRQILEVQMSEHQAIPFAELEDYLDRRSNPDDLWNSIKLSLDKKEAVAERIQQWLHRFYPNSGRKTFLEPYQSFCHEVQDALQHSSNVLLEEDSTIGELKQSLAGVRQVLQLKKLWDQWEALYDRHLGQDKLPFFVRMKDDLKKLRQNFISNCGESALSSIFESYDLAITKLLQSCQLGIDVLAQPGGKKQAEKVRLQLKRQMRQVDVAALLQQKARERYEEQALDEMFSAASEDHLLEEHGGDDMDDYDPSL